MNLRASLSALLLLATVLRAEEDPRLATLRAADDARVAATLAPDRSRLDGVLSAELRYAHSNGAVDDKASLIDALEAGRLKYLTLDYAEREFSFPAPGIAIMSGRVRFRASMGDKTADGVLGFLAVWREEGGQWRLLSWQSTKLPMPEPAAK
jgi:Domain of unknown function (DUF4440)